MVNSSPSERRTHPRHSSNLSIRLVHLASRRNFPCRCVDLSTAGACLLVPARMPIASGHKISLLPHNHHDAQSAEGSPFGPAVVVRVDRESMLRRGQIAIGVCFEGVQQPNTQP